MTIKRHGLRIATCAVASILAAGVVAVPGAQASDASRQPGTRSLAAVLTKDTGGFDRHRYDFDVVTAAVLAVLGAKPDSPVKVLTDGSVALTAFLPNDRAFQLLVRDITGASTLVSEQEAFAAVAGLGIDTVETVLLYHVVAGATIDARTALRSDGAVLTTAQGSAITVDVQRWWWLPVLSLADADTDDRDPRVIMFDINKGNRQIAHGIDRVLRPVNLP